MTALLPPKGHFGPAPRLEGAWKWARLKMLHVLPDVMPVKHVVCVCLGLELNSVLLVSTILGHDFIYKYNYMYIILLYIIKYIYI